MDRFEIAFIVLYQTIIYKTHIEKKSPFYYIGKYANEISYLINGYELYIKTLTRQGQVYISQEIICHSSYDFIEKRIKNKPRIK